MPHQKQKLPLIQVPGTDMVDTTATHTDTEDTTEDIHTDMEVPWILLWLGFEITSFNCNTIARYPTLPYL